MKAYNLILLVFSLCLLACGGDKKSVQSPIDSLSQEAEESPRFEDEIKAFELEDISKGIVESSIIFTGSSSIRKWDKLKEDMAPLIVLNRGFGGATTPELQNFAPRFLYNQKPSVLVFYCGENDISEGASVDKAVSSFINFHREMRDSMGNIPFVYLSMKPSIARWDIWPQFKQANSAIKEYLKSDSMNIYLDVSDSMIVNGEADKTIFLEDNLHMNNEGYRRWTTLLKPVLLSLMEAE